MVAYLLFLSLKFLYSLGITWSIILYNAIEELFSSIYSNFSWILSNLPPLAFSYNIGVIFTLISFKNEQSDQAFSNGSVGDVMDHSINMLRVSPQEIGNLNTKI